jgi:heavy metal sensor kinase
MMAIWRPRSVRLRLALWYGAAVALVILAYAAGVYIFVNKSLREELDRALHDDFEIVEQLLNDNPPPADTAWAPPESHHADAGEAVRWIELWGPERRLRFRSAGLDQRPVPGRAPESYDYASFVGAAGSRFRTITGAHSAGGTTFVVRVTRSEARLQHELNELLIGLALGLPVAVILAGIGGYQLARRTLAPVERMTEQAQSVTAERLRSRVPVDNPDDELGRLATVINEMLRRIEEAFDRLKRFTADASHELRTPLTAIRSVGEVALREPRDPPAYRDVIGSMLEETDRLTSLVERLLLLSRADSGSASARFQSVPLLRLARDVGVHLSVLADERGQSVDIDGDESIEVEADPILLRESLVNVVDNAIAHSPHGGQVRVRVRRHETGEAMIEVIDSGPGIAPEHRERIFDRFFRVDEGRARHRGGAGLGLSIAQWAVGMHGGRITVDAAPAGGSIFRILLPVKWR